MQAKNLKSMQIGAQITSVPSEKQLIVLPKLNQHKFFKFRKLSFSRKRKEGSEELYNQSLKLKISNNLLKEENRKLKTHILIADKEVEK